MLYTGAPQGKPPDTPDTPEYIKFLSMNAFIATRRIYSDGLTVWNTKDR
jgi:hypothetical protein